MASTYLSRFASPAAKLVRFFENSRDQWKAKHHQLKIDCKRLENQTRAVERSREQWRQRSRAAEQRVKELEREIEQLKLLDD